jgi:hypothetical protein
MFMNFNIDNFLEKALGQASNMLSAYFDWHFCALAVWSREDEEILGLPQYRPPGHPIYHGDGRDHHLHPWALTCKRDLMVSRAIPFTRDPSTLTHTYTLSNITTPNLAILSHCVIWTFCKMSWVASRPLSGMTVTARNSFAEPHIHQQGPLDPVRGKPRPPSCHLPRQPWTALAVCYPGRT